MLLEKHQIERGSLEYPWRDNFSISFTLSPQQVESLGVSPVLPLSISHG